MNKLISDNCWFGCDWVSYEVGYLGLRAGQLSPACAVVYLWNTGYLRVTRPRSYPGIQHKVPHSLLNKRHNKLSYHRVREAIAAKILVFHWCDSSQNKSDTLSKHWEFSKEFHIIRDLFDFQGKITLIQ